jgi:oligopeptide transport system substrate-binding protein
MKTDFVTFDTSRPPFDDVQVRQAFAQSIDRQKLADKVMRGYAAPAKGGFIPPGMPGHSLGVGTPFDPVRARRLFDAAGYPDSSQFPPVEWLTPKGFESVSTFLQRQWQTHLGLSIEFQVLSWDAFTERLALDPPQMLVVTWRADYPDPDSLLRAGPAQHFAAWNDEVYGWLLDDARQTTDLEERMAICRQMDRMLAEEAVILPLTYGRDHLLVKPWIKLLPTSPINWWYWQEIVIENH